MKIQCVIGARSSGTSSSSSKKAVNGKVVEESSNLEPAKKMAVYTIIGSLKGIQTREFYDNVCHVTTKSNNEQVKNNLNIEESICLPDVDDCLTSLMGSSSTLNSEL